MSFWAQIAIILFRVSIPLYFDRPAVLNEYFRRAPRCAALASGWLPFTGTGTEIFDHGTLGKGLQRRETDHGRGTGGGTHPEKVPAFDPHCNLLFAQRDDLCILRKLLIHADFISIAAGLDQESSIFRSSDIPYTVLSLEYAQVKETCQQKVKLKR
jgi:hypothetical protein